MTTKDTVRGFSSRQDKGKGYFEGVSGVSGGGLGVSGSLFRALGCRVQSPRRGSFIYITCYVMLRCDMLRCLFLCYVSFRCVLLCYVVICYVMLCLYSAIIYYTDYNFVYYFLFYIRSSQIISQYAISSSTLICCLTVCYTIQNNILYYSISAYFVFFMGSFRPVRVGIQGCSR